MYRKKQIDYEKNLLCRFFFLTFLGALAQSDSTRKLWLKHKIWIYNNEGDLQKGVLISTTDSSLKFFPGKFSDWHRHSKISVVSQSYLNISNIKIHKRDGLIRGMLIGTGIGLSPILFGAVFGEGQGGAQGGALVSVFTLPVGIIAGAIIGSTAKKKFFIGGQASKFHLFHKRIKY